jgi:structural maintenance of chromosome 2
MSVKLNVNNPHFLIMQGRVTKVINMKPPEVLGLIEEASGVSQYQLKKQQSEELIKKKEFKI